VNIPVLAHEIGQWCAYPEFGVIEKFTGYLRPSNYRIFRHVAEQEGVAEFNREFAWASGKFQLACYKEELEANLRTPGLAGHQMLDIRDYLGQGTALIGVLDAFWDPKSYVTAEEFRRFHSATVPLARLKQRTFTTAETLRAEVELYHFGEKPLAKARPYWKIVRIDVARRVSGGSAGNPGAHAPGYDDHVVARGKWPAREVPNGKNIPVGEVSVELAKLAAPGAYRLVVGLADTPIENDWKFWVYPAPAPDRAGGNDTYYVSSRLGAAGETVIETRVWSEAEAGLARGGRVLFTPNADDLNGAISPAMKKVPVFWNIQMTVRPPRNPRPRFDAMLGLLIEAKHPALAGFPTEAHCDFQWTPLIDGVRSVNLRGAPRELRPIVAAIDDWNRNWRLGVIFECRVGEGRLRVSAIDLDKADASAGARQLRRSLLDYAASDKFEPAAVLAVEEVRALWTSAAREPGQAEPQPRAFDPDLDDGGNRSRRKTGK
jgi:beta-galactosidase